VGRHAFATARPWLDEGLDLLVAVNLSTRDLQHSDLATDIAHEIKAASLPAANVDVEVTDRVVMGDDTLPALVQ
jgi:EAL domain-containing protein (putative c-di-GMP-specific phosphodiesterase class I)